METKTFSIVTTLSMVVILTAMSLSLIGVVVTGLYPGIFVFCFLALIPIGSKFYTKKIRNLSNGFRRNYYTTLTVLNLISILVVAWMTFVILIDRVLSKIV